MQNRSIKKKQENIFKYKENKIIGQFNYNQNIRIVLANRDSHFIWIL